MIAPVAAFGSVHAVPSAPPPFVQPGPPLSPAAFDHPPAYHAQSTDLALNLSPIVGAPSAGNTGANVPVGCHAGNIVFTALLPQARCWGTSAGSGQAIVSGPLTSPLLVGV